MGCVDHVWPNLPVQKVCLKDPQPKNASEKWPLPLCESDRLLDFRATG